MAEKYKFDEARKGFLKEFMGGDFVEPDTAVDETDGGGDPMMKMVYQRLLRNARLNGVPSSRADDLVMDVMNLYNVLITTKYSMSVANYLNKALTFFYKRVR